MPVPGGTTRKFLKRVLSPAQEDVALLVALELELGVDQERRGRAVLVDLHRVVDDEIDGLERVDALRIAAERLDGVAHGGEIDDRGNAGEVLQQHAARAEGDLLLVLAGHVPLGHRVDVGLLHEGVVFVPQQILEENLEAEGKLGGVAAG